MHTISIIIPAHNAMEFLPKTLDNVLKQTYKDFEIIVVNDGSSDNIEQWASTICDPRFKLISQQNQGVSEARNRGIAESVGEFIAFLDADDLWQSTKLEKQVKSLEENPEAGLVYTWTAIMDEQGTLIGKVYSHEYEGDVWQKLTAKNIIECGSLPLIRRVCFETLGNFDTRISYSEDWDMWLRIAANYPFKVVKEPLVYYRKHSGSASRNLNDKEKDYQIVIEKNFASVAPDLQYLKNRSYGHTYLTLAWKALQSEQKDYQQAINFQTKALKYYPQLRFSQPYIRLAAAIALNKWLKPEGYEKTRSLVYSILRLRLR